MIRVLFISDQIEKVFSGPGRFVQYIKNHTFEHLSFDFVSLKYNQSFNLKSKEILNRLNSIDISNYHLLVFENAIFLHGLPKNISEKSIVFVNDDNYLLSFKNYFFILKKYSFKKLISRLLLHFIEIKSLCKSKAICTNSNYMSQLIEKKTKCKPIVLNKPVDTDFFSFSDNHSRLSICFIKNDYIRGGFDFLVDNSTRFPSEIKDIFCVGFDSNKISPQKIHILGVKDAYFIRNLLQKCFLFVLPSYFEAYGLTVLEAMSCGCIPLVSNVGGLPEVIPKKYHDKLLFDIENANDFIKKMDYLYSLNEKKIEAIRLDLRIFAEKLSVKNSLPLFENILLSYA